ncbi:5-bromo-4-chloroindolyl phosphate hydrolysis family protein [Clostridium aminobutyricum]|uniref:5-bromo-4-chloroindolyl phosphate hydrolysis family protein n=1 Tax=Clostridium aminobutyricum TaxID=33953 RepID=A0A939DA75_CLOAM|nr:5-bromo-4-chloroindolyl phosphate hydrolysis family protein [Clostridium aminobutyricum]MBN7773960.1 5-bromo-4-chloroindolyl phosphate hydrolysis family protein [Clostridium aminobutyricum]
MKNDNFIDFGEEISRTVKKVLNNQDFYDLKKMINRTMQNGPRMGEGPFYQGPFGGDELPPLSKANKNAWNNRNFQTQETRPQPTYHKKTKGTGSVASTLFLIFGILGSVVTGLTALVGIVAEAFIGNLPLLTVIDTVFGILFIAFLFMTICGVKLKKRLKRFSLYKKVLNGRTYCMIEELTSVSEKETKFIVKDLRNMIKAGLFAEGYLDEQETCLMTDYTTYTQYMQTVKNAKERQEAEKKEQEKWANREGGAELKKTIDEGKNYIRTIKEANDALPEVEISEKLDVLETVTTKIFDYVEQHPEKLPEIRKFMCYYMPITLKMVKAYQKFDEHGKNISEVEATKLEIKGSLDTINRAYQNLMNKLMQDDILDVSSDISALETILAQEGLTE